MVTQRKIEANRLNARASTGPKTKLGKSRAKRNARRHGLSIPIFSDPNRSVEIESLALKIACEGAPPHVVELARSIASVQIDLARIRWAQHELLSREIDDPEFRPKAFDKKASYVVRELSRLMRVYGPAVVVPQPLAQFAEHVLHWKPQGAEKLVHIVSDLAPKLGALDRYERRALSRRKFAIRALDTARTKATALGSIP